VDVQEAVTLPPRPPRRKPARRDRCDILPQATASQDYFHTRQTERICSEAGPLPVFLEVFFQ